MSLDDLVNVSISASSSTPSKPGFGTILIAAQKVPVAFTSRARTFASLKEMTDFGFLTTDPAYLAASAAKAQNPAITNFKVGKRLLPCTQTIVLTCMSAVEGDVYNLSVAGHAITYTVLSSATPTTVATAISALIDALSEVSSTHSTSHITVTAPAGTLFDVKGWSDNLQLRDTTTDPGIATDLAAILTADANWYGLALDSQSPAETLAAAAWVEANKKVFAANTSDFDCTDSNSTTDIMFAVKAAAYARTGVLYSRSQLLSYSGCAWTGKQFAGYQPGQDTWAYKTLAGVTVDALTGSDRAAILGKNGNTYEQVSNVNITNYGTTGSGEYFDITRFIDWLRAEIQFRLYAALVANKKISYTDAGIDYISSIIGSALEAGVENDGLVKGTTFVTTPKVGDIDSATKATRVLSGVKFGGQLQGAVHNLVIAGELTK